MSDIVECIRMRRLPLGGTFELMDDAADEIAWLRAEVASLTVVVDSLTAEVMHLRNKLDKIAECARWNLEPPLVEKPEYSNQKPTIVRCVCGWRGETTALVESMGTHTLHCPKCYRAADG